MKLKHCYRDFVEETRFKLNLSSKVRNELSVNVYLSVRNLFNGKLSDTLDSIYIVRTATEIGMISIGRRL